MVRGTLIVRVKKPESDVRRLKKGPADMPALNNVLFA
jgi:hypothetical protein